MRKLSAVLGVAILVSLQAINLSYAEPEAAYQQAPTSMSDIVDTAVADGRFTTLVAAVQAAGLVGTLKSEGPFTVFAPTDTAFAELPAGTVEALLADIPALRDVLLFHVVPGAVSSAEVATLSRAETAGGKPVAIAVGDGSVSVNGSRIIVTDVMATNGIIHVIDAVLIPPAS